MKDPVSVAVKKEILTVQEVAHALVVTNPVQAEQVSEILHRIKEKQKVLTDKKTDLTRPLMESLAAVKELFAPYETSLKEADTIVRKKMLDYTIMEQDRREAAKAKIAESVEQGKMRVDTAVAKLEAVGEGARTSGIQTRTKRELEITDEDLIPREYCVPDRVSITKALFEGIKVPGAKLVERKILAVV